VDTAIWIPLVGVGLGAAFWVAVARRKGRQNGSSQPRSRTSPSITPQERIPGASMRRNPPMGLNFDSVSVQICHHPCQAAREIRTQRFLPGEVPDLPLPGCDRKCHCSFVHHTDRREENNRRAPYLNLDQAEGDLESLGQRSSTERRKS